MDPSAAFFDESHHEVQKLLPWFVTGELSAADRARVADHLAMCAECRTELGFEQALKVRVADMPVSVELGWAALRGRLETSSQPVKPWPRARRLMRTMADRPRRMAFAIVAQCAILLAAVVLIPVLPRPAPYHALGAAPSASAGTVIVMFRPDTKTAEVTALLASSGARIVDGPTAAGAFVVAVPIARRAAVLAQLRARPALTMAEPLDP